MTPKTETAPPTDDLRIRAITPVSPPRLVLDELPVPAAVARTVTEGRRAMGDILAGRDDRLAVVIGPCSIHDPRAADASHANSRKVAENQAGVADDIGRQVEGGDERIFGVMVESHLLSGRQDLKPGVPLVYGRSVTDACIDWETSVWVLERLARAVQGRRERSRTRARVSSVSAGR